MTLTQIDALNRPSRKRGQEYLLERRLLQRLSTGDVIEPKWTQLAFPPLWHYDVLRALDYLRAASVDPDPRVDEAMAVRAGATCRSTGRLPALLVTRVCSAHYR